MTTDTNTTAVAAATPALAAYTLRVQAKHAAQAAAILSTRFGVEIEMVNISRPEAAAAVCAELVANGIAATVRRTGGYYDKHEVVETASGRAWTLMSDSSLRDLPACRGTAELVTPILCGAGDIELVQKLMRALREAGAKANDSCGIHVHTDGRGMTSKHLAKLSAACFAHEAQINKALNVDPQRRARYCQDTRESAAIALRNARNDNEAKTAWYTTNGSHVAQSSEHYDHSRYHGLNLHSFWYRGTVEFRWFNGTMHAGKVRAYIMLCLALNVYARTGGRAPTIEREEASDRAGWQNFLFRTLGLRGDENANVRAHLMAGFNPTRDLEAAA